MVLKIISRLFFTLSVVIVMLACITSVTVLSEQSSIKSEAVSESVSEGSNQTESVEFNDKTLMKTSLSEKILIGFLSVLIAAFTALNVVMIVKIFIKRIRSDKIPVFDKTDSFE